MPEEEKNEWLQESFMTIRKKQSIQSINMQSMFTNPKKQHTEEQEKYI